MRKQILYIVLLIGTLVGTFVLNPFHILKAIGYKTPRVKKVKFVVLKDDQGKRVRFSENSTRLLKGTDLQVLRNLGVKTAGVDNFCRKERSLSKIENEMELNHMIKTLQGLKKPRLTATQKQTISRIKGCEDYEFELAVISRLLRGDKLINAGLQNVRI